MPPHKTGSSAGGNCRSTGWWLPLPLPLLRNAVATSNQHATRYTTDIDTISQQAVAPTPQTTQHSPFACHESQVQLPWLAARKVNIHTYVKRKPGKFRYTVKYVALAVAHWTTFAHAPPTKYNNHHRKRNLYASYVCHTQNLRMYVCVLVAVTSIWRLGGGKLCWAWAYLNISHTKYHMKFKQTTHSFISSLRQINTLSNSGNHTAAPQTQQ